MTQYVKIWRHDCACNHAWLIKEAEHLAKINKERANTSKEEEELWESLERDDEEDEEYDEADYE